MPRVLKDINPDTGIAQGKKNKTRNFSAFFVFSLFAHLWFVFLCDIMIAQSKGGYCYERKSNHLHPNRRYLLP